MSPPAARPNSKTSARRDEKQGRGIEGTRAVRVFGENGFLIACLHWARDSRRIHRLLAAPNAVPVWSHGGKLVGIRLNSLGDDRGQSGERRRWSYFV